MDFIISQNQVKKPESSSDLRLQMKSAQILYRNEGNSEYQNSYPSTDLLKQNEEISYVPPK